MKISNKGIEMIKEFEGFRAHAYLDSAGVYTIGYGHTKNVVVGDAITTYGAESLLREDLEKFEAHVNSFSYDFSQNEFDSLVSFAFNIGSINQLTQNGTRNKKQIADAMLKYCNATVNGVKTKLKGLENRRKKEREVFIYGYGNEVDLNDPYKIAIEVWSGKWGNGEERKKRLENAGLNYDEIQHIVNLKPIALEVLEGKWGNGGERISKLASAGYAYSEVQTLVNHICAKEKQYVGEL